MGGGALQEKSFAEFGGTVVLYCHITSHVKGEPHADLPSKLGVRGFPTFLVLDPAGAVLVRHEGPRTAEGFAGSVDRARAILALRAKAAEGDVEAKLGLLLQRVKLRQVAAEEARKELDALGLPEARRELLAFGVSFDLGLVKAADAWDRLKTLKVTDDERKDFETRINNLAVMEAVQGASRDPEKLRAAGRLFAAMKKDGRLPTGSLEFPAFWRAICAWAESEADAALYEEGLKVLEEKYGGKPGAQRTFDAMRETLRQLKERTPERPDDE